MNMLNTEVQEQDIYRDEGDDDVEDNDSKSVEPLENRNVDEVSSNRVQFSSAIFTQNQFLFRKMLISKSQPTMVQNQRKLHRKNANIAMRNSQRNQD